MQCNDDQLLDEVFKELSSPSHDFNFESPLMDVMSTEADNMDFPDFPATLPLGVGLPFSRDELLLGDGGLPNLDFYFANNEQIDNNYIDSLSIVNIEEIDSSLTSPMSSTTSELDEILDELSNSSSSDDLMNIQETDFNSLIGSIIEPNFMQELLNTDDTFTTPIDYQPQTDITYSLPESSNLKRKASETIIEVLEEKKNVTLPAKCMKYKDDVLPITVKTNETEKEAVRRIKNNVASKVTRAKRRQKHGDLIKQETELLKNNAQLTMKFEVMQKEAAILRQLLVSKLSSVKS